MYKTIRNFLMLLLFFGFCLGFGSPGFGFSIPARPPSPASGSGASVACNTSSIVFWWRAEALDFTATNGTLDYTAGTDTTFSTNNTPAINTDAVKYGTNGLDIDSSQDYIYIGTPSTTLDDEGSISFWIYFNAFVDEAGLGLIDEDDWQNRSNLRLNGTDELEFRWTDHGVDRTHLITTSANITTGQWYYFQFVWKTSTNYREIFVDNSSEGSSSATIHSFETPVTDLYFGDVYGRLGIDYFIDNVIVSNSSTFDAYSCKDETEWPE